MVKLKSEVETYKTRLHDAEEKLQTKESEIRDLHEELDKVKSVLQQKVMNGKPDILATVQVFN